MNSAASSIVIHRPADDIFASMSDVAHAPEWQGAVLEAKQLSAGVTSIGTTFRYVGNSWADGSKLP